MKWKIETFFSIQVVCRWALSVKKNYRPVIDNYAQVIQRIYILAELFLKLCNRPSHILIYSIRYIWAEPFQKLKLHETLKIIWRQKVKYHNWRHALNVCQTMFTMLKTGKMDRWNFCDVCDYVQIYGSKMFGSKQKNYTINIRHNSYLTWETSDKSNIQHNSCPTFAVLTNMI